MIPNDQLARKQMISNMLMHLTNLGPDDSELTKWETDFVSSIAEQFEQRDNLSDKQCEILERIYNKV